MSEWIIMSRGDSERIHHHAKPGWIARKLYSLGPNAIIECSCGVLLKWILTGGYADTSFKWVVIG